MDDSEISNAECEQIQDNHQQVVTRGREPGLTLINNDQTVTLKDWGIELLAEMAKTAALFDQAHNSSQFSAAIKAQKAKLLDPELTPSAQVLKEMQDQNFDHGDFVMQQAQRHKETLLSEAPSSEMAAMLEELSQSSLVEQQQIEAADAARL